MAEIIGELNKNATYGEVQTRKLLGQNLPKEYKVYVESPIQIERDFKYPDFVVVTNFGFIVLEVKDWLTVTYADPHNARVLTKQGQERTEPNPVSKARDYAIALTNLLNRKWPGDLDHQKIPWSYAAVLFNLKPANLTQVRGPWGEWFVFGQADLENPDILLKRLRETMPPDRMRSLTKPELDHLRAVIYPISEFKPVNRDPVMVDYSQEKIITEPVRVVEQPAKQEISSITQQNFLTDITQGVEVSDMPELGKKLLQNFGIRLIRGFAGTGKTVVMIQRAKYLAALYPDWNIGILTFNRNLKEDLDDYFQGSSIEVKTFHSLCFKITRVKRENEVKLGDWIKTNTMRYPVIFRIGAKNVEDEIDRIRDIGIESLDDYIRSERKGAGTSARFSESDRREVFNILDAYRTYLAIRSGWDYSELPKMALRILEEENSFEPYDALLVDEAQDWAPFWFRVINKVLKPETGILFMSDDPSQSIYRYYSWKEKGVNVVGRTRWLKVPYRNTFEIYRAAYNLIDGYPEIQASLQEEGEKVVPEISKETMRTGDKPIIKKLANVKDEKEYLYNYVGQLRSQGYRDKQIAILLEHKDEVNNLVSRFKDTDVRLETIHSFKGLEAEVVILPFINKSFLDPSRGTDERRLFYMGMSRARSLLLLTYSSRLPEPFQVMVDQSLVDHLTTF